MKHSYLIPVFTWLRVSLNLLFAFLVGFVIVRALVSSSTDDVKTVTIAVAVVLLVTYGAGGLLARQKLLENRRIAGMWLGGLTVEWLILALISPDAIFIVFPLFFLYLHLLPTTPGVAMVVLSTVAAIIAWSAHNGWTGGAVVGPTIGAAVAVAIALGYRTLYRESEERRRLIHELMSTRQELAEREREAGILSERARLAREIHDTVAQGLSSIQILLHAAERADASRPGIEHIRLARETASMNLAETRRFIEELTPVALQEQTLTGALRRLAEATRDQVAVNDRKDGSGLDVSVRISGDVVSLPMTIETALLRVAQAALTNVVRHAHARHAAMTLTYMHDAVSLDVVDDGIGFDPLLVPSVQATGMHRSFGLVAMRDRVEDLGGTLTVESRPGEGTAVAVTFGVNA
ncbi:MAG: sensor histidine kinase [Thermomicrobiales bacterium]